jgi:transposase InsO family protein
LLTKVWSGTTLRSTRAKYFADQGVERHQSAPHMPQQNGVVERCNQSVVAMVHTLLK